MTCAYCGQPDGYRGRHLVLEPVQYTQPMHRSCMEDIARTAKPVFISGPTNYELTIQRGQMTFRYSGFGPDQLEAVAGAIADAVQATLGEFTVEVRHGP